MKHLSTTISKTTRIPLYSPGVVPYLEAWDLQRELHARVVAGALPGALIVLQHPHVFTLGRRGKDADVLADAHRLAALDADVVHTDRGGEVTYHGPGQLVGYPLVDLRAWGGGPHDYVRAVERVLIATLADFDIEAESDGRPTGVWAGDAKIAAIGVKVSRGVTMHGFALNVEPDLSYFSHIVPCGMPGAQVTSIAAFRPGYGAMGDVVEGVALHFARAFNFDMEPSNL